MPIMPSALHLSTACCCSGTRASHSSCCLRSFMHAGDGEGRTGAGSHGRVLVGFRLGVQGLRFWWI